MEDYLRALKIYALEHPSAFDRRGVDSVLDTLYWNFSESNKLDNDVILDSTSILYDYLEHLCFKDREKIIDLVLILCNENARLFFEAGVRVGFQLSHELT